MRLIDTDEAKRQIKQMENLGAKERLLFQMVLARTPTYEPPNPPLTLEELREMDGNPVWVQYGPHDGEWVIVAWNIYDAISYVRHAPFELSVYSYDDDWIAYRRKPEDVV